MNKDKKLSLKKYMDDMINRLSGPIPEKHKDHPQTYHNFLRREISIIKAQLEAEALEASGK